MALGAANGQEGVMEKKQQLPKISPQMITAWNKELERLHKALIAVETGTDEKNWIKDRIESLHKLLFGIDSAN